MNYESNEKKRKEMKQNTKGENKRMRWEVEIGERG